MMEDSQSASGFGGQICDMVGQGEADADAEFNRPNLFQWVSMERER